MWIVKLGGSMVRDARLRDWLQMLAEYGGGLVTVVPGGAAFADAVREAQARWRFDDVAAHNMAVLAMAQTGCLLQALQPALQPARSETEMRAVLRRGRSAVWLPVELMRERADAITSWDVSSDSLALGLAQRLNAERLLLVKSCAVDPSLTHAQLAEAGVLDRRFATLAQEAALPVDILQRDELARARAMLIGEARASAA